MGRGSDNFDTVRSITSRFIASLETPRAPLQWYHLFGRTAPVEFEIGFGKGMFLLKEAAERPQVNFVGVERAQKYFRHTLERIEKGKLANVRLICADAHELFSRYVRSTSLQAIHIYFPDPWPKKRHHKRRLITPGFLTHAARCLTARGALYLATDEAQYFEFIIGEVDACRLFSRRDDSRFLQRLVSQTREFPVADAQCENETAYLTHYERKYRLEGRRIYGAHYEVVR